MRAGRCSPRSCVSPCHAGSRCSPRSCVSPSHAGSRCSPHTWFSAFRARTAYIPPCRTGVSCSKAPNPCRRGSRSLPR
jgi:hypothetical protein